MTYDSIIRENVYTGLGVKGIVDYCLDITELEAEGENEYGVKNALVSYLLGTKTEEETFKEISEVCMFNTWYLINTKHLLNIVEKNFNITHNAFIVSHFKYDIIQINDMSFVSGRSLEWLLKDVDPYSDEYSELVDDLDDLKYNGDVSYYSSTVRDLINILSLYIL